MATIVPPPSKRQRIAQAEKFANQQDLDTIPDNLGTTLLQFYDENGQPQGPRIVVPIADCTVKNLNLLVNKLQGKVCGISVSAIGRVLVRRFGTCLELVERMSRPPANGSLPCSFYLL